MNYGTKSYKITDIQRDTSFAQSHWHDDIDGLVQDRRNSSALAMELRLSCTNPYTGRLKFNWQYYESKVFVIWLQSFNTYLC